VRENAEDRIFGNVGALKHLKRRNPELIICLCGCMTQQPHIAEKIKKSFPYVDLVLGTSATAKLPELLYRRRIGEERQFPEAEPGNGVAEGLPIAREGTVKAFLPIMYGCDNFCSYCVVPLVRGREKSREKSEIIREAKGLIQSGYKDITLLGQNVNSYGKGLSEAINFAGLLKELAELEGDFRLRFMTSHPKDANAGLFETIAAHPKICSHIHLPVQSGSNRILIAMNRHYTREDYLRLIELARKTIPGVSFTSDIIVGFPGETRDDFEETLDLVKEVAFHSLFTFVYSKRVGTKAADLPDPVTKPEKMAWFQELLDMQQKIGAEKYAEYIGQEIRVLAEGAGKGGEGCLTGRSEANIIVEFAAGPGLIGEFVKVKITGALNWALLGEIVY
jgi:tRNA-2-methylthio-N6-dimethylallyladenosine synthase